jgi:hypothetical protein
MFSVENMVLAGLKIRVLISIVNARIHSLKLRFFILTFEKIAYCLANLKQELAHFFIVLKSLTELVM